MPPRAVGPYDIVSVLGRGGIGTVYRAHHRATGKPAAVKLLPPSPAADARNVRRLAREFEALSSLDHPNVVRVFEAGVAEGYSFLAMELVEGLDLRAWLSPALDGVPEPTPPSPSPYFDVEALGREADTDSFFSGSEGAPGPEAIRDFARLLDEPETDPGDAAALPRRPVGPPGGAVAREPGPPSAEWLAALNRPARLGRLVHAVRQVCDGLAHVHARGLVHRDLKPSNIMVDDTRRVRLMDFGLVSRMGEARPAARVVGTYRYMAPEQARGEAVDGRADLYSVGVILWEMLAGRPPFPAAGLRMRHLGATPAPSLLSANPGADPRLAAVTERLLMRDPGKRFQRAEEVIGALG
ncbi:MAG: serine/threonine protein kinase [Deltaproteobacteria bacterium]|nr:serine/threonine protein kinase [Deltaproteobacteria bacterium]